MIDEQEEIEGQEETPEVETPVIEQVDPMAGLTQEMREQIALEELDRRGLQAVDPREVRQQQRESEEEPAQDPYGYQPPVDEKKLTATAAAQAQSGALQEMATRRQLERTVRSDVKDRFPGLPESEVEKIVGGVYNPQTPLESLQRGISVKRHLEAAALAHDEALRAGRIKSAALQPSKPSGIDGDLPSNLQLRSEDRQHYEDWLGVFGRAYTKDGKIDHKLARARFKEAVNSSIQVSV